MIFLDREQYELIVAYRLKELKEAKEKTNKTCAVTDMTISEAELMLSSERIVFFDPNSKSVPLVGKVKKRGLYA